MAPEMCGERRGGGKRRPGAVAQMMNEMHTLVYTTGSSQWQPQPCVTAVWFYYVNCVVLIMLEQNATAFK